VDNSTVAFVVFTESNITSNITSYYPLTNITSYISHAANNLKKGIDLGI